MLAAVVSGENTPSVFSGLSKMPSSPSLAISGAYVTGLAEYGLLAGLPNSWEKETAFSAMSGVVFESNGRGKKGEVGLFCFKYLFIYRYCLFIKKLHMSSKHDFANTPF